MKLPVKHFLADVLQGILHGSRFEPWRQWQKVPGLRLHPTPLVLDTEIRFPIRQFDGPAFAAAVVPPPLPVLILVIAAIARPITNHISELFEDDSAH